MITRLVKMTFKEDTIADFLKLFEERKERIKANPGCLHLEMLQEKTGGLICFTYSIWDDELSLEAYRQSSFFKETWTATKKLFAQRAEAWTTVSRSVLKG